MRRCGLWSWALLMGGIASFGVSQQYHRQEEQKQINPTVVKQWETKFGTEMWKTLGQATQRDILAKDYNSNTNLQITEVDGYKMVKGMAEDIQIMMQHKTDAVKRIMELAENVALDHKYDKDRGERLKLGTYHYTNAKKLNVLPDGEREGKDIQEDFPKYMDAYRGNNSEYHQIGYSQMNLTANKHFSGIPVNTSRSSVHVPTNVNDEDPKVINAIDWSKKLDDTFRENYKRDPSMSWQYFGSSTGFMRHYPAIKWQLDENNPDLYDARMRDWYKKSAASPKDIIILLDTSGSMTGLGKEIAKHVVLNILETLGEDDFVTVLKFSKDTTPLVKCFVNSQGNPELVQATKENLAEFVDAVEQVENTDIANITSALVQAFTILQDYSTQKDKGSNCNQAIMLVTDGVPYKVEEIFYEYNQPHIPVRMFPYLIGQEISDMEKAKWMACENKGYFTHVTTLAEVKEQVLKYLPVMARPMVLLRKEHPARWTGVYADVEDPKTSKLMISVSIPVYNKGNYSTRDMLRLYTPDDINPFSKVRIAELLGVAGTDVPIEEIKKFTPPYKMGVNGYSFMVNNNGYILYHPDLRPTFKEILKPNYNSVDLTEVELVDNDNGYTPRQIDSDLYQMRKQMVEQKDGQSFLKVKVHFDEMKRATIREQDYFFTKITNTAFSLGIVFPQKYGKYRVSGGIEINELRQNAPSLATHLDGKNWKLHPNWEYCEYQNWEYCESQNWEYCEYQNHRKFNTTEQNMRHFVDEMFKANGSFNWGKNIVRPPPKCKNNPYGRECAKPARLPMAGEFSHYCDKELVQMLFLDAQITKVFTEKYSQRDIKKMFELFGINLSFVATRSGLTRWKMHPEKDDQDNLMDDDDHKWQPGDDIKESRFPDINNKATDEVWYKRAVEYQYNNPESFVFSVPFDVGDRRPTVVTATHAIFKGTGQKRAAAAVVGVLLDYDKFKKKFFDSTVSMPGQDEEVSCESESFKCYVVDNNGFVVISEESLDTGKFFGQIESAIFLSLVNNHIFKTINIFDYQAICFEELKDVIDVKYDSPANALLTPFKLLIWLLNYVFGQIAWLAIHFEIRSLWNPDWTYAYPKPQEPAMDYGYGVDDYVDNVGYDVYKRSAAVEYKPVNGVFEDDKNMKNKFDMKNKTRPKPCDKETYLYELNESKLLETKRPIKGVLRNCHESNCERPFVVTMISHTNLILVMTDTECPCSSVSLSVEPTKVDDNSYYCKKLKNNIYRKRPDWMQCINYHPQEEEISLCGAGEAPSPAISKKLSISLLLAAAIYHAL